jgi:hypothetical protein
LASSSSRSSTILILVVFVVFVLFIVKITLIETYTYRIESLKHIMEMPKKFLTTKVLVVVLSGDASEPVNGVRDNSLLEDFTDLVVFLKFLLNL